MRRVCSIWFPALAIERWTKASDCGPDDPVVLTVEGTHGPIIHAVTKAAAERGAKAGARLTDARALDPALVAVPADPAGDEVLLQRLAKWAQRWSPLVEVDGPDALRLDVTGVAHLFGGEAALIDDVRVRFAAMGLMARVAIAPTAAGAWALARFPSPRRAEGDFAKQSGLRGIGASRLGRAPSPYPLPDGERELEAALSPLHVSALRLDPDTVRTLERLGLKTIGALAALPRLALARRFRGAENVVDALDRTFGRKPEPLTGLAGDPPPRASLRLEEPATHPEAAPQALERLIPKLVTELEERQLGSRKLSLHGFRVDGSIASASVGTAIASREPKHLRRLLAVPRLALARRFRGAEDVVDALDRALGRKPEPLTAAPADPPPRALVRLEEPATHPEAAPQALERLIPELVRQLQERHLGARRLSLTGYRVDGSTTVASVATTIASREPKHLARLLADKAAALDPEFGFDAFALTADWSEELGAAQESLVEEPSGTRELARLVDRLTVKLGARRVRRPQAVESYLPECASGWVGAVASSPSQMGRGTIPRRGNGGGVESAGANHPSTMLRMVPLPTASPQGGTRPQRLLDRPEAIDVIYATPEGMPRRFVWRRGVHDIARAQGPERIAPEWWRQPSTSRLRDYYRVEDAEGRRYWIYREGVVGDGRGGAPNWFIHGLFG